MTPEEQQIAIAKACGWTSFIGTGEGTYWNNPEGKYMGGDTYNPLPDYLNDYAAMHEAEKTLGEYRDWSNYVRQLHLLIPNSYISPSYDGGIQWDDMFPIVHATPAQRAEAFLKALSLWVE